MKVLQLGPYPPPHGGVQTNIVAIREYLSSRNIPNAVINLTRFRKTSSGEVFYPQNAFELIRLLVRLRYDVVHIHIGGNLTTRLLALCLVCHLLPRPKTVLTFHSGGYASSPEGRRANPGSLRGVVLRRFDALVGVNEEIRNFFLRVGVNPRKVHLIAPYAAPKFDPLVAFPSNLGLFIRSHRPWLLTVGLLEPEYDLQLQIRAMGEVLKNFPNAGLVIVGSGSLELGLFELISSRPWAGNVLLLRDVSHAVTLKAIKECDLFLRTTHYDGDSIAVREALHFGTPVIATDNGMRPPGVHLIPPRDLDALLRAIEEELVAEGRKEQVQEDSGVENLQAVLNLYQEVLGLREKGILAVPP